MKTKTAIMTLVILLIALFFMFPIKAMAYVKTGHDDFMEITFVNKKDKLLINRSISEIEEGYKKISDKKIFGWKTYYFNVNSIGGLGVFISGWNNSYGWYQHCQQKNATLYVEIHLREIDLSGYLWEPIDLTKRYYSSSYYWTNIYFRNSNGGNVYVTNLSTHPYYTEHNKAFRGTVGNAATSELFQQNIDSYTAYYHNFLTRKLMVSMPTGTSQSAATSKTSYFGSFPLVDNINDTWMRYGGETNPVTSDDIYYNSSSKAFYVFTAKGMGALARALYIGAVTPSNIYFSSPTGIDLSGYYWVPLKLSSAVSFSIPYPITNMYVHSAHTLSTSLTYGAVSGYGYMGLGFIGYASSSVTVLTTSGNGEFNNAYIYATEATNPSYTNPTTYTKSVYKTTLYAGIFIGYSASDVSTHTLGLNGCYINSSIIHAYNGQRDYIGMLVGRANKLTCNSGSGEKLRGNSAFDVLAADENGVQYKESTVESRISVNIYNATHNYSTNNFRSQYIGTVAGIVYGDVSLDTVSANNVNIELGVGLDALYIGGLIGDASNSTGNFTVKNININGCETRTAKSSRKLYTSGVYLSPLIYAFSNPVSASTTLSVVDSFVDYYFNMDYVSVWTNNSVNAGSAGFTMTTFANKLLSIDKFVLSTNYNLGMQISSNLLFYPVQSTITNDSSQKLIMFANIQLRKNGVVPSEFTTTSLKMSSSTTYDNYIKSFSKSAIMLICNNIGSSGRTTPGTIPSVVYVIDGTGVAGLYQVLNYTNEEKNNFVMYQKDASNLNFTHGSNAGITLGKPYIPISNKGTNGSIAGITLYSTAYARGSSKIFTVKVVNNNFSAHTSLYRFMTYGSGNRAQSYLFPGNTTTVKGVLGSLWLTGGDILNPNINGSPE